MTARDRIILILLGAITCSPVAAMVFWAASRHAPRSVAVLILVAVLLALIVAALARTWKRFFLIQLPLVLLSAIFVAYAFIFRMVPGTTLAQLVAGASLEEVHGMAALPQWSVFILALGSLTAVYVVLIILLPRLPIRAGTNFKRALLAAMLLVTAYGALNPIQLIDGIALDPVVGSAMFLGGDLRRAKVDMAGARIVKVPYEATRSGGEEVHVLIIGESVRRDSWSAYGYSRDTTPFVNSIKAEAVLLQNAIADANLTEYSVPILLTGMAPDAFAMEKIRGNIFDLAREAGYSTAWLVNQELSISLAAGVKADRLEYPPDFEGNINGRHAFDETLLPAYQREIARAGSPRFIGIHMMGSHWEYYRRYPGRFQAFGSRSDTSSLSMISAFVDSTSEQSSVLDAYDNTLRYSDWFLGQLIERLRGLSVPATLTYFPDHGEDLQQLDGEAGHGGPRYTRHAFEIPAFVWVNSAYQRLHPEVLSALRRNASKEVRSHDVFYTMAQLMGITWPGAVAARSFASDAFVPDISMKHIAGGVQVVRE